MGRLQVLLLLAVYQQAVWASSKFQNPKFPDNVPSAKELDARLERIQKTLTAALENKAILRQGEDANAQENSHKIALTEEERKHVNNIMRGIEEDDSSFEDIDRLNAILSTINEKFDRHERAQRELYNQEKRMRAQYFQPKSTMRKSHYHGREEELKSENANVDDMEDVEYGDDIEIEDE